MKKAVLVCLVLGLGLLATLVSGLYMRDFSMTGSQNTRYRVGGLPISWYGEPETSGPDNSSAWYSWQNFVFDAASWSFVFAIFSLMTRKRK